MRRRHGLAIGLALAYFLALLGDQMLYVAFLGTERVKAFRRDIEGELRAFVGALPDAPPIAESRLAGPLVGKLDLTNEWRRPSGDLPPLLRRRGQGL